MLKKYSEIAQGQELKMTPSSNKVNLVLNYSKALEVRKTKNKKKALLIHLN